MKKILKSLYFKCSFITRPLFGGFGHILMLHRICPPTGKTRLAANAGMEITPTQLEDIIRFFTRCDYEFISMDQLVNYLDSPENKKKFVVFTFDDGYADNLLYAYPVFKKYNVPFTVYITTSFPDRQAVLWWYILEDLLLDNHHIAIKTRNFQEEFDCRSPGEKEETFFKIRSLIMNTSASDYLDTVKEIFDPFDIDYYEKASELTLSWGQIKQLSQDPLVTIGAHTVNHYTLSKLPPEEMKKEILDSKHSLESHLNSEVSHFAFPYGGKEEAGPREFAAAKETGFKTAVTTRFANIFPRHNQYKESLPRIFIPGGAGEQFFRHVINGTLPGLANKFKRIITV